MKLTINERAWAIISDNAVQWHEEYRKDRGTDIKVRDTVDLLYANRCNDHVNSILRRPVNLDETVILLDRFWAGECESAKSGEFRDRVKWIVANYEEVVLECGDVPDPVKEEEDTAEERRPLAEPAWKRGRDIPCYGYQTAVEILTPYMLRLSILGEGEGEVFGRILLDPVQARKLQRNLEAALEEYESAYGDVGEEYGAPTE